MTREEAIKELKRMKYPYNCKAGKLIISNVDRENEALDMAISDMTAISKIRAKLNTEYNNTSGDVQAGIAIALGILDRYTKGESQ